MGNIHFTLIQINHGRRVDLSKSDGKTSNQVIVNMIKWNIERYDNFFVLQEHNPMYTHVINETKTKYKLYTSY